MRELAIAFGGSRTAATWKNEYLTWEEFLDRIREVRRTDETMAEYDAMDKTAKGDVKDGPGFVGGFVKTGRRKKANIESRSLITLDADSGDEDFLISCDLVLSGTAYVVYSTHSHRPGKEKYRLVVPLDRDVTQDEYAAISRKLADLIGLPYFDHTTFDIHRLMYFPSCSKDAEPVFEVSEGKEMSADGVLAQYEDWTDVLSWPRHEGRAPVASTFKAENPLKKRGVIGAFCRAYPIVAGIEEFLAEVYRKGSMANRYTYIRGSSANGLEVYPETNVCYSHQDSDPVADGHCYNIFDLVRVHKFGALDAEVAEDSKKTRPSVVAMEKYAIGLEAVKRQIAKEKESEQEEWQKAFSGDDEEEDPNWEMRLERHHRTGEILSTSQNIELLLSHGALRGVFAYDEFRNTEVIRSDLPWREKEWKEKDTEPWLGADDRRLRHWLNTSFGVKGQTTILDAFTEVSRRRSFHPIKEYLEATPWDGVPRIETLFIDYLGAEDSHYVRQVTRKAFLAAVTRIYRPGTKFDQLPVLIGAQGAGKSSLLAKMGGEWFSDALKSFDNKEAGEHLQAGWIFEIAELAAMKRAELEEAKMFFSKTSDKYRVAYDRVVSEFLRKCIFFGTTNTWEFLLDPTGNRRYWPIAIDPAKRKYDHFEHLTEELRAQLWAEVLYYYLQGEDLLLDAAAEKEARRLQALHSEEEPMEGIIQEWLDTPMSEQTAGASDDPHQRVCAIQLWREALEHHRGTPKKYEIKEIREIMRKMDGWMESEKRLRIPGYGVQRVFERVKNN